MKLPLFHVHGGRKEAPGPTPQRIPDNLKSLEPVDPDASTISYYSAQATLNIISIKEELNQQLHGDTARVDEVWGKIVPAWEQRHPDLPKI